MNYNRQRLLEREIVTLARQRGFHGDPWASWLPDFGPLELELAARSLTLDVRPLPRGEDERSFAERIARSIVLTSERPVQPVATSPAAGGVATLPKRRGGRR